MAKPKFFLLLTLIISLNFIYSQRPNTKKVAIPYLQFPSNPLNKNIETYVSKVVNYSTLFQISNIGLNLKGYENVASIGEADLEIKFVINNASFTSKPFKAKYKKKVNDSTYVDAEGGRYMVVATVNFSEYIRDLKNDKLLISNEGINISNQFTSDLIKNYGSAIKQHNNNRESIAIRIFYENTMEGLRRFKSTLNSNFGYPLNFYYVAFARGRGKKFDYSDLERSFKNIERITEIINSAFTGPNPPRYGNYNEEMKNELFIKLEDTIKILNNSIKEYVPRKKKTKISDKIIDHLYINLATAYFLNGELNKASETLKGVKINKGEIKAASQFNSKIQDVSKRLKLKWEKYSLMDWFSFDGPDDSFLFNFHEATNRIGKIILGE